MNDTPTPTPRTDNFKSQGREWLPLGIFEKVERELTAALEASTQWEAEAWRSDELLEQRDNELTAAREEIKELNDKLDDAVSDATNAVNDIIRMKWQRDRLAEELTTTRQAHDVVVLAFRKVDAELAAVTEQRDMLAEALNKYRGQIDNEGNHSAPDALQSLNQNVQAMASADAKTSPKETTL